MTGMIYLVVATLPFLIFWSLRRLRAIGAEAAAGFAEGFNESSALRRLRERQCHFGIDLPETHWREALTYESSRSLSYRDFLEQEGKSPLALLRLIQLEFVRQLPRQELEASELLKPGSPIWYLRNFGYSRAVSCSAQRFHSCLSERCPNCGNKPRPSGHFRAPGHHPVVTYTCRCGNGFALWRPLDGDPEQYQQVDQMVPSFVMALKGGLRYQDLCLSLVIPPQDEDPVPPMALVFKGEELLGAIHYLTRSLHFHNDLNLAFEDRRAVPIKVTDEQYQVVKSCVEENYEQIVEDFCNLRKFKHKGQSIWALAGLPEPTPYSDFRSEPLIIRDWFSSELVAGVGRSPHYPIMVYQPQGEHRYLKSLRCPNDYRFQFRRMGTTEGSCPNPGAHQRIVPTDFESEDESAVYVVDKYYLECECGEHAGHLYFDMYHPEEAEGFS